MRNRFRNKNDTNEAELNLIPVMNLFVCLVPFLLISASFIPLGGMDVKIPKAATQETPANKQKDLGVTFEIKNGTLAIAGFYNDFTEPVAGIQAVFASNEAQNILAYLNEIENNHKKIELALLHVDENTRYEEAIHILNIIRSNEKFANVMLATEVVH